MSAKLTHFVDNPGTLAFALFMALWGEIHFYLFFLQNSLFMSRLLYLLPAP